VAEAQFIQHLPAIHIASPFVTGKVQPINTAYLNKILPNPIPLYSIAFADYVYACMSDAPNKFWTKNQDILPFILFN
jgi:hypothetical protein